jgi:hypothetical protein
MATIIEHPDTSTENLHNAIAYIWEYTWAYRLDPKSVVVDDDLIEAMVDVLGDDAFSRKAFERRVLPALVEQGMLTRETVRNSAGKVTGTRYSLPEGDGGSYANTTIPRISVEEAHARADRR